MKAIGSNFEQQPGYPYTLVLNKERAILNEFRGNAEAGNYTSFFTKQILQY